MAKLPIVTIGFNISYDNYSDMCYHDLSEMNFNISRRQKNFLSKVDKASNLLREYEEECYLNERINDMIIPVFKNIGMLGCPISSRYGGLG